MACEGSVTRACEKLHLAQPTVSGQRAVFEKTIGEKLLRKNGRKLALADTGRVVFQHADALALYPTPSPQSMVSSHFALMKHRRSVLRYVSTHEFFTRARQTGCVYSHCPVDPATPIESAVELTKDSTPIRCKLMIRISPMAEKLTKTRHGRSK